MSQLASLSVRFPEARNKKGTESGLGFTRSWSLLVHDIIEAIVILYLNWILSQSTDHIFVGQPFGFFDV